MLHELYLTFLIAGRLGHYDMFQPGASGASAFKLRLALVLPSPCFNFHLVAGIAIAYLAAHGFENIAEGEESKAGSYALN